MSENLGLNNSDPRNHQNQRNISNNQNQRQFLSQSYSQTRQFPILGHGFHFGTPQECRKQTFWQMLTNIFCPFFKVATFIFAITIIDIIIFIISVSNDYNTDSFLQPTENSLDSLGAKNPQKLQKNYQIWRLLSPILLHANITHMAFNLTMQLILGFRLQPAVGSLKTGIIYIGSGFGGVLFSCLVSPTHMAVGASTALFGITTSMIAWIVMNWKGIETDPYRSLTLIWLILMLVLNLVVGFASTLVDNWGHFGGGITGFILAWAIFDYVEPATHKDKLLKYIMASFIVLYYIGGLALFYTVIDTE